MTLEELVASLGKRNQDIKATALFDAEGLPLASSLAEGTDAEEVSALSAQPIAQGESLIQELGQGSLQLGIFRATDGITVLTRCSADLVFAVLASPRARLGLLLVDVTRCAQGINKLLE